MGKNPLSCVCASYENLPDTTFWSLWGARAIPGSFPSALALPKVCVCLASCLSVCLPSCLFVCLSQGLFDKLFSKQFLIPALPPSGI